jgi:hypothetical protein
MDRPKRRTRAAIALAAVIAGAASLAVVHPSRGPVTTDAPAVAGRVAAPMLSAPPVPVSMARVADGADAHVAGPDLAEPAGAPSSVVGRLRARYRSEDLELLAAVSRRTSGAAPAAIHRLLDAARAGADDTELTRIIREDVEGALVRHDCFEWLRRRRGDPRPKPPALASRARTAPAR